jgi:hypothetical protein
MKITLSSRGLIQVLNEPDAGDPNITEKMRFGVLLFLSHYIHPDLKAQYLMEECPKTLWNELKARYKKQKQLV